MSDRKKLHFEYLNCRTIGVDITTFVEQIFSGFRSIQNDDDVSKNMERYDVPY
jgi:hypothetical protein